MLTVIDFYAENPIVGKTLQSCFLEDTNVYDNITGNGDADWTIYNTPELRVSSPNLKLYGTNVDINWEYATIPGPIYGASPVRISGSSIKLGNPAGLMGTAIELYSIGQLYIPGGSSGDVVITDGAGNLSFGSAPVPSGTLTVSNFVVNDLINEVPDGVQTTWQLTYVPNQLVNTVQVFVNGLLQRIGAGQDYTLSNNTIPFPPYPVTSTNIIFSTPPQIGDEIIVNYIK